MAVTQVLLGAFAKLRKATKSFFMPVRLSELNNSAPTKRIFIKFGIWTKKKKKIMKIQDSLKYDKNNGYFTRRTHEVSDHVSLSSSLNEKCCRQKL
jgi:hypothetical protein